MAAGVLKPQPPLISVSKKELYACPGGAHIGNGSKVGYAPPMTVLFGHLQEQIVLTEPL